ncbi:Ycf66 family protein [Alkalinema pantanalense CENA528]|uniref:Ycf66 family protein n=1 Tax=Alkalinema pantanalense TaxID=1620705 RepID=UPI003D6FF828
MLTYLLALAVGLGSLGLYGASFVVPAIARKNDMIWSGVGLFYALVLWVCAGRITGGVLLGQIASVALIGWFGWQAMQARWEDVPEDQRASAEKVSQIRDRIQGLVDPESLNKLKDQAQGAFSKVQEKVQEVASKVESDKTDTSSEAAPTVAEKPLTREDFAKPPIVQDASNGPSNREGKASSFGSMLDKAKSFAGGLSTPKNKETYVRKDFQEKEPPAADVDDDFDFGDVSEKASEAAETVTDSLKDAQSTLQAKASDTAETVKEVVTEKVEQGATTVEAISETVSEKVETVAEDITDVVEDASEVIQDKLEEVAETAQAVEAEVVEEQPNLNRPKPRPQTDA